MSFLVATKQDSIATLGRNVEQPEKELLNATSLLAPENVLLNSRKILDLKSEGHH